MSSKSPSQIKVGAEVVVVGGPAFWETCHPDKPISGKRGVVSHVFCPGTDLENYDLSISGVDIPVPLPRERVELLGSGSSEPPTEIEESVILQIRARRDAGRAKYQTSMERQDLTFTQWLQHLQEELLDAAIYVEKLKREGGAK